MVAIGQILAEVKTELAHREFLTFVEAVGLSRSTAYRWMAAAEAAAGCSHVENVEATALYALAARSTPENVRDDFFRQAAVGQRVTLQEVQTVLRTPGGPKPRPEPNHAEAVADAIVAAEEAGAGRDWRRRDVRTERVAREIGRFREDARAEVAAAVDGWGRACVAAAAPYLSAEPTD